MRLPTDHGAFHTAMFGIPLGQTSTVIPDRGGIHVSVSVGAQLVLLAICVSRPLLREQRRAIRCICMILLPIYLFSLADPDIGHRSSPRMGWVWRRHDF